MRATILSAVLGLGALGVVGAMPTEAKAGWPPYYTNSYRVGPYASFYAASAPRYNYYANPYWRSAGFNYYSPAFYTRNVTPFGYSMAFQSRGGFGFNFHPFFGLTYSVATPGYMGWSYTPYTGYRSYSVPGVSYTVPAGYVLP